jgi:hypothetical protein
LEAFMTKAKKKNAKKNVETDAPQVEEPVAEAVGPEEDASVAAPVAEDAPQVEGDVEAPEEAEAPQVERDPTRIWKCPDPRCRFQTIGAVGSNGWKAWKSHVARHAHAHPANSRWDPKSVKADYLRRNKLV